MNSPKPPTPPSLRKLFGLESLAGQSLALVPLIVGLLFGALALPRNVPPEEVPAPTIDARSLARLFAADDARAAQADRAPLPASVRAIGSAFRAFNAAEAARSEEATILKARSQVVDAIRDIKGADTDALLELRAFQLRSFLTEARRFEQTGEVSQELREVGGTFVDRMKKAGWCEGHHLAMPEAARRAAFKLTWNRTVLLEANPQFALALDETRALYAFYFANPHPFESERAHLDATLPAGADRAACARAQVALDKATASWLLVKIGELAKVDPAYPTALARAAALFMKHDYRGSAALYSAWLDANPSGLWVLRAQNHLRAALLASDEVAP